MGTVYMVSWIQPYDQRKPESKTGERTMFYRMIQLSIWSMLIILAAGTGSNCYSDTAVRKISTSELKMLLDEQSDAVLVNVLPPIIHDSKHLPGSVNYPIGKMERERQLPFPMDQTLVFYCMGVL